MLDFLRASLRSWYANSGDGTGPAKRDTVGSRRCNLRRETLSALEGPDTATVNPSGVDGVLPLIVRRLHLWLFMDWPLAGPY